MVFHEITVIAESYSTEVVKDDMKNLHKSHSKIMMKSLQSCTSITKREFKIILR